MRIAIGSDHAAYDLRQALIAHLGELGHEVIDLGTPTKDSTDYPIYGAKVARAVVEGAAELGVALCGTGVGISIAANKVPGARAVCCSEPYSAVMSRRHNDANVLCMGARVVGDELAKMILEQWLGASFEGGRHARRVDQLKDLDVTQPIEGC